MPGQRRRGGQTNGKPPPLVSVSKEQSTDSNQTDNTDESFQRELTWVIDQLKHSLIEPKSRLHAEETVRMLKVLSNPKQPYVKKRQFMRSAFGDYRKKMEEESKKFAGKTKKITLKQVSPDHQKSTFIKKGTNRGDEGFNFNFNVESGDGQSTDNPETSAPNDTIEVTAQNVESSKDNQEPAVNYYKLEPSGESFKFNFTNT